MNTLVEKIKRGLSDEKFRKAVKHDVQLIFAALVAVVLLVTFLSLHGCKFGNGTAPQRDRQNQIAVSSSAGKSLALEANVETRLPANKYLVVLKWKTDLPVQAWVIHRQVWTDFMDQKRLANLEGSDRQFLDGRVDPGRTYLYLLGSVTETGYHIKARAKVTIPSEKAPSKIAVPKASQTSNGQPRVCIHILGEDIRDCVGVRETGLRGKL